MSIKKVIAIPQKRSVWEELINLFRSYLCITKPAPSKTVEKTDEGIEMRVVDRIGSRKRMVEINQLPLDDLIQIKYNVVIQQLNYDSSTGKKTPLEYGVTLEAIKSLVTTHPRFTRPQLILRIWIELVYEKTPDLDLLDILGDPDNNPWYSGCTFNTMEQDLQYLASLTWIRQRRGPVDILFQLPLAQLCVMNQEQEDALDHHSFLATMMDKIQIFILPKQRQLPAFKAILERVNEKTIKEALLGGMTHLFLRYIYADSETRDQFRSSFMDTSTFEMGRNFFLEHPCLGWFWDSKHNGIVLENVNFKTVISHIFSYHSFSNPESELIHWITIWNMTKCYFLNTLKPVDLYDLFQKLIESKKLTPEHQLRLMKEFVTLTKDQLTAETIGKLIHTIAQQKNANADWIDYLIVPCEAVLVHMNLALFASVREALLTALYEETISHKAAWILGHLYDQVFLKQWRQYSDDKKQANINILQSELEAIVYAPRIFQSRKATLICDIKNSLPSALRLDADFLRGLEKRITLFGLGVGSSESEWEEVKTLLAFLCES